MFASNTTLCLVTALLSLPLHSLAYSQKDRDCNGAICLTSFVWCLDGGCEYGDDVWPLFPETDRTRGYAFIRADVDYNITWKHADSGYPVMVSWSFPAKNSSTDVPAQWSINTTDSRIVFNPLKIMQSFPIPQSPDTTPLEAQSLAARMANVISISQPDRPGEFWGDATQQFSVQNDWFYRAVDTEGELARRAEHGRWAKGVGVGVGVGVPCLLAGTALVSWRLGSLRGGRRAVAKV